MGSSITVAFPHIPARLISSFVTFPAVSHRDAGSAPGLMPHARARHEAGGGERCRTPEREKSSCRCCQKVPGDPSLLLPDGCCRSHSQIRVCSPGAWGRAGTVSLLRGCGQQAQRPGKNPEDLEPRQCRGSVWGGLLERLQFTSDDAHVPQTPYVAWTELHNTLMCRINSIYFGARGNVQTYMVSCHCLGMNPWAPPALPAQARSTQTLTVEPACWASAGSSSHRQEHRAQPSYGQELPMFLCLVRPRGTEQPIGFFLQIRQISDRGGLVPAARLLCSQDGPWHHCF